LLEGEPASRVQKKEGGRCKGTEGNKKGEKIEKIKYKKSRERFSPWVQDSGKISGKGETGRKKKFGG